MKDCQNYLATKKNFALPESNYKASLQFENPQYNTSRNRFYKKMWLNPPFTQNVETNIGNSFEASKTTLSKAP